MKNKREESNKWWRSLSVNEMKNLEKKYNTIYGIALPSEVYKRKGLNAPNVTNTM